MSTDNNASSADKPLCFVIMSFSGEAHLADSYELAVKPTVEELNFRCERVDEQFFNGGVMEQVRENIREARFIIADMTGSRPNCYYELGLAHALEKEVILIAKRGETIHFDISGFSFIFYERIADLRARLGRRIEETIIKKKL